MDTLLKKSLFPILVYLLYCIQIAYPQEKEFPYKLKVEVDIPILATGLGLTTLNNFIISKPKPLTTDEILNLNASSINRFDRFAMEKQSASADKTSGTARNILIVAPAALGIPYLLNKEWQSILTLSTLYLEAVYLTVEVTELTKISFKRKRPYLYNQALTVDQKLDLYETGSHKKTFISGHTSIAFCSAVFLSTVYTDIYGRSPYSRTIWITSLTAATLVGYLRIESGMHFPTDVIAGAAVGSLIGYAVPRLHKQSSQTVNFAITGSYAMLTIRF